MRSRLGIIGRLAAHITALVLLVVLLFQDQPQPGGATPSPLPSAPSAVTAPLPEPMPPAPEFIPHGPVGTNTGVSEPVLPTPPEPVEPAAPVAPAEPAAPTEIATAIVVPPVADTSSSMPDEASSVQSDQDQPTQLPPPLLDDGLEDDDPAETPSETVIDAATATDTDSDARTSDSLSEPVVEPVTTEEHPPLLNPDAYDFDSTAEDVPEESPSEQTPPEETPTETIEATTELATVITEISPSEPEERLSPEAETFGPEDTTSPKSLRPEPDATLDTRPEVETPAIAPGDIPVENAGEAADVAAPIPSDEPAALQPDESGSLVVAESETGAARPVAALAPLDNANLEVLGDHVYWLDAEGDLEAELAGLDDTTTLAVMTPERQLPALVVGHPRAVVFPADPADLTPDAAEHFIMLASEAAGPLLAVNLPGSVGGAYFKGAYLLVLRNLDIAEVTAEIEPELRLAGDARDQILHRLHRLDTAALKARYADPSTPESVRP